MSPPSLDLIRHRGVSSLSSPCTEPGEGGGGCLWMPTPNMRWTNTYAHLTTTAKAPTPAISRQPGGQKRGHRPVPTLQTAPATISHLTVAATMMGWFAVVAVTKMGWLVAEATTMGQLVAEAHTAMGYLVVDAATTIGQLMVEPRTAMGSLALEEATMMGQLGAEARTAMGCPAVGGGQGYHNGAACDGGKNSDGASYGGSGQGYGSRMAAPGGGYNDCVARVGDHSNGATHGVGYDSGVAACGSGSSICFAVCGYEGPSHREHLRSLRKLQQYHHQNPVTDSMGDLSKDVVHDNMTDFDNAFLRTILQT